MKKFFKSLKRKLLTIFGDIKVFKWPLWIVYDPSSYISGEKLEALFKALQPGDIVLHGYLNYLDGYFIPGKYSHSGVYIGDGKIIHAVAEGVCITSIYTFFQCDCAAIVRLSPEYKYKGGREDLLKVVIDKAHALLGTKYDFDFRTDNEYLYCHELTATCYKEAGLEIDKYVPKLFGGLIKGDHPVYLAKSFLENKAFDIICEV